MNPYREESPPKKTPFWCLHCGEHDHVDEDCAIKEPLFFNELMDLGYHKDKDCATSYPQSSKPQKYMPDGQVDYPQKREVRRPCDDTDVGFHLPFLIKGKPFMWCLNCGEHDHDEKDCKEKETLYWDEISAAARKWREPSPWKIAKTKPNGEVYCPDDDED